VSSNSTRPTSVFTSDIDDLEELVPNAVVVMKA
jgi:hypothetical protein